MYADKLEYLYARKLEKDYKKVVSLRKPMPKFTDNKEVINKLKINKN